MIVAANRCYFGLLKYFKSSLISRTTKILVEPDLTYASETWPTKADEKVLLLFERKILCKIYGPTKYVELCRRRANQDLYKDAHIVQVIKLGRLRWAGHLPERTFWNHPKMS